MNETTQTPQPNKVINIPVYRDGELDSDYMPEQPTVLEQAQTMLKSYIGSVGIDLKARAFDMVHGTDYARIRRELLAKKREERFIASIGLRAIKG